MDVRLDGQILSLPKGKHLSREKTRELLALAQQGDEEAKEILVERNLRLVYSVVQRFHGLGTDLDDLFQVGSMGLIKAIERFDLSYDVAFSTYAVPLIIGEIRRHLREDRPLRVGRTMQTALVRAKAVRESLTQRLGRSPTPEEIAQTMGLPREEVVVLLDADRPPVSLDHPIENDDNQPVFLRDQLASHDTDMPTERLALSQVLQSLNEEERTVIALRYLKQLPQTQVAQVMDCSQAHISRMERRIIERLRRLWQS